MQRNHVKIGINKCCITPPYGIWLAGFSIPDRRVKGVYSDLYLTTLVMEQDAKKVAILAADIIGFGREFVLELKQRLCQRFGFKEDEILFNASHTHSGPQTLKNMNPDAGEMNNEYIAFLQAAVVTSIENAMNTLEDVDVYYGKTLCSIGVNRRKIVDGKVQWAPFEDGITDRDVMVVKFTSGNKIKAVLFNYACHPSTIGTNMVSADYPGKARDVIENGLGGETVALFVQGCSGDIRVRTVENGLFRTGTFEDVEVFGEELGKKVLELCSDGMKKISLRLSTGLMEVELPLQELPDLIELEAKESDDDPEKRIWAEKMISEYSTLKRHIPYAIQRISLGNELVIIGMDGEVCTGYGLNIKKLCPDISVLTAGYCNGVTGYIPTGVMFDQGGYEPDTSRYVYLLPAPFGREIERILLENLKRIL